MHACMYVCMYVCMSLVYSNCQNFHIYIVISAISFTQRNSHCQYSCCDSSFTNLKQNEIEYLPTPVMCACDVTALVPFDTYRNKPNLVLVSSSGRD